MEFEVRKVWKTYKNLKIIKKMDDHCFPDDDSMFFGHRDQHWWIVYREKEPVAYAGARKWGAYFFLNRAGVMSSWRGQQLQELLIRKRIQLAKTSVITYTSYDNIPSNKNLIKCGFKLWDPPEEYHFEGFLNWILPVDSEIIT